MSEWKKISLERRRRDLKPRYQEQNINNSIQEDQNKSDILMRSSRNTQKYIQHLNETNKRGHEDSLPFFVNVPPIQGYFDLSVLADQKIHEVYRTYDQQSIEDLSDSQRYDFVTIIPYRGRYLHLNRTIESLVESANLTDKKICFLIIENSSEKTIDPKILQLPNVKYRHLKSNGKIFNKCICHNLGVAISNSDFVHFHDCDLIVPPNFYSTLFKEHENHNAIQCFTKRRVNYINESPSLRFFDGESIQSLISDDKNYRAGAAGAPGGSISLSRDLFLKCGGFDSHFFWAYSIEDKFFWRKVERFDPIKSLDDPAVELYHIWHPPGWGKNPYERFEQRIYQIFDSDRNWQNYINKSIELYQKSIEYLLKK